jgi:hypothetical protein
VHEALWLPIKKMQGVAIGTVCKVMQRSLRAENWSRLSEQFPAKDKWFSAGFFRQLAP